MQAASSHRREAAGDSAVRDSAVVVPTEPETLDQSVREEAPGEDSEGSAKHGGAEGPGSDIKVRVVKLQTKHISYNFI